MKCPNCGANNNAEARFCSGCAAALSPQQQAPAGAGGLPQPGAMIGQTIDGKYRLDELLGAGGMGAVYRATRLLIGDAVAVKVLRPEHVSDAGAAERFRREAQAAARLKHPNAVSIYDFGVTQDGLVYLVMEMVEGESLRHIIKEQGPLTPSAAAEVMRQVCSALDDAHSHGVVHRDLKPDNVIVRTTQQGLRVKVLDFGIAKLRDSAASNLTQTGSVMGTPRYMSPEQCVGEELDSRSDIYSLGVMLYEMLCGAVPFNSPTSTAVVIQHVTQQPPSLRAVNMSVPEPVERAVLHALQKRREDRPQSAGALAAELDAALGGYGTSSMSVATAVHVPAAPPAHSGEVQTVVMPSAREWASGGFTPTGGTPAATPAGFMPYGTSPPYAAQPYPQRRGSKVPLVAVVVVCLLAGLGAGGYFLFAKPSPRELVLDEVKKNLLVKPDGGSAYDVYISHRGELSPEDRRDIGRKVQSSLEKRGDEIVTRVKQDLIESEADWSEAARAYEWLNELDPRAAYESRRHFALGRLGLMQKDYNRAQAEFQRSIQLDASWALPVNSLGRVFYQTKDKVRAKEQYRRATEIEPAWVYPWINLGALYFELKDMENAESALRRALSIDSGRGSVHNLLGDVLDKQGRPCDAIAEYRLAVQAASNSTAAPGFDLDSVNRKIQKLTSESFCW